MEKIANYIGGEFYPPSSQSYIDNVNPATAKVYSLIPDSDEKDLLQAIDAAEKAKKDWANTSVTQRSQWLRAIADEIDHQSKALALAETTDNGKPLSLASSVDIPRASFNFRFFADIITQFSSESHAMGRDAINYTVRDPIGVVGCISPWNLPLYLFTWKIAPALITGNCVIAKPSEVTPMTAFMLAKICQKVDLPRGVLNIVHGYGHKIGNALVSHPSIKAVSFTGGTKTGAHIASIAAPQFKKLSLELGGKNPTVVFDDCDWEYTLNQVVRAAFANQGQICLCGSRIFVQKSIYEAFKEAFVAKTCALRVGDPLDDVDQGAMVSEQHATKVLACIDKARQEGARILTGGDRATISGRCANGFFVNPTVLEGLDVTARTNQEEIFGPVTALIPFSDEQQVIDYANATDYGLSASIWSQDIDRCHRVAQQIESGTVWVNTWMLRDLRVPFGGMKNSGVGREGGVDSLRFFTEAKNICIKVGH